MNDPFRHHLAPPRPDRLVSIVIPAWNAEATIGETLRSVRAQTHRALDVIVIDDGSSDTTAEIVAGHAATDPRIRLISVPNAGVAAARNLGVAKARSDLIAPIDADDLWAPETISRQLATMEAGGRRVGYVYAGHRRIDAEGRVTQTAALTCVNGPAYLRSLVANLVGHGSGLLFRREAFDEVGGYEPELRRLGLEGSEDRLFQTLVARSWEVRCTPACLIGYRQIPGAMSRDSIRMLHSQLASLDMVRRRHPETPSGALAAAKADLEARLAIAFLRQKRPAAALLALARGAAHAPRVAADVFEFEMRLRLRRRRAAASSPAPRFLDLDPDTGVALRGPRPNGALLARLARQERSFMRGREDDVSRQAALAER